MFRSTFRRLAGCSVPASSARLLAVSARGPRRHLLTASMLLVALAQISALPASASPINYNFSGQLSGGGIVTGTFTTDSTLVNFYSFSFDLSQAGLPYPFKAPNPYNLNDGNGYVNAFGPGNYQFQLFQNQTYVAILDLNFNSVPGSLAGGDLREYPNQSGSYPLFYQTFVTGSAGAPEPAGLALIGGGLVGVGWLTRKRQRPPWYPSVSPRL